MWRPTESRGWRALLPLVQAALCGSRRLSGDRGRRNVKTMLVLLMALILTAFYSSPLDAQIYEWRDASGSRNFTNDIEDIPELQREQARVVVRARRGVDPEVLPDESVEPAQVVVPETRARRPDRERRRAEMDQWRAEREQRRAERESPKGAQVVYDNSFRFSRPEPVPVPQVNINIAGPLAVSQVVVAQPETPTYVVDPGYDIVYAPLVSTSYGRHGRFRHPPGRVRGQDRYRYDRNKRFSLVPDLLPIGPLLRPDLPRAPRFYPASGSRQQSVLRR